MKFRTYQLFIDGEPCDSVCIAGKENEIHDLPSLSKLAEDTGLTECEGCGVYCPEGVIEDIDNEKTQGLYSYCPTCAKGMKE